jgi:hypothetical protein
MEPVKGLLSPEPMTDRNPAQRTEPKGGAPVPVKVKVKDRRAVSLPSAPVREPASGKYRRVNGGRRGQ